jgi:hypothetical protein
VLQGILIRHQRETAIVTQLVLYSLERANEALDDLRQDRVQDAGLVPPA